MKSNRTICGTAMTFPQKSKVFRANLRQRRPNTMKVGMKEAAKMLRNWAIGKTVGESHEAGAACEWSDFRHARHWVPAPFAGSLPHHVHSEIGRASCRERV